MKSNIIELSNIRPYFEGTAEVVRIKNNYIPIFSHYKTEGFPRVRKKFYKSYTGAKTGLLLRIEYLKMVNPICLRMFEKTQSA